VTRQPQHPGLVGGPVYLDYNATTPVDPRVVEAMVPHLQSWFGNPSSDHAYSEEPRAALEQARRQVGELIGAQPSEIIFTGSGSEADLLALRGATLAAASHRTRLITQATEHPAILQSCAALHRLHGIDVTVLPVDGEGLVDPAVLEDALTDDTALVSIMAVNNETGALQRIAALAELAHRRGALFHSDAAQAVGKIAVDVGELGVDLLTVVGHKMYAPKGTAALYVRDGLQLEPVSYGGGQERGLRAGTESVALAVALGTAASLANQELSDPATPRRIAALRDDLHHRLTAGLPGRVTLNGPERARLPNTLNISIADTLGHELLAATPRLAASTGSACHSGTHKPSPVLSAMGVPVEQALAAIRISLGRWTTVEDITAAAEALVRGVQAVTRRRRTTDRATVQLGTHPDPLSAEDPLH
jgi:cysteine desulfurase